MALPPKRGLREDDRQRHESVGGVTPLSPRTRKREFAEKQSWYVTCLSAWSHDNSFSWLFVTLLLFLAKVIITTLECEGDWVSAIVVLLAALIPCCMWAVFFVFMSKRGRGDAGVAARGTRTTARASDDPRARATRLSRACSHAVSFLGTG